VGAAVVSCKGLLPDRGGIHDATRSAYLLGGDLLELGPPKNTESEDIYLVPADHWEEADRR
jgi:hypothetical protein